MKTTNNGLLVINLKMKNQIADKDKICLMNAVLASECIEFNSVKENDSTETSKITIKYKVDIVDAGITAKDNVYLMSSKLIHTIKLLGGYSVGKVDAYIDTSFEDNAYKHVIVNKHGHLFFQDKKREG